MTKLVSDNHSVLDFFKSLELKSTDVVLFSSDVSRLAMFCKSKGEKLTADIIINCLQEILFEGTILIPAFTDNLTDGDLFNWEKSKPTTGAVSNKVQRRKDFVRTRDPLHSFFVWGKDREEILNKNDRSTFGKKSVFAYLRDRNAKFVLLDVHLQDSLTYIHYVEEQNKVNYRKRYTYNINCVYAEGEKKQSVDFYSRKLGVRTYLYDLYEFLLKNDLVRVYQYGKSKIDVLSAEDIWNVGVKCINDGPKLYRFSKIDFLKDFIKRHILRRKGVF